MVRCMCLGMVIIVPLVLAVPVNAQVRVGQIVADTVPGGEFSLAGEGLSGKRIEVTLERDGTAEPPIRANVVEASKVIVKVPETLVPGRYLIRSKVDDESPQFVGQVTIVLAPKPAVPIVRRTVPTASWTKLWWNGLFDFDVIGERLPTRPEDLVPDRSLTLRLDEELLTLPQCVDLAAANGQEPTNATPAATPKRVEPCYSMHSAERIGIYGLSTKTYGGPHQMTLETPNGNSAPASIRISRITPRMIKWLSLACLALLILSVALLGTTAGAATQGAGTTHRRLLNWLLLDQQTNSFSLSKAQLLMWLVTVVYCYVFVQLARVFVQGNLTMAELPDNFEFLLGITGGTAVTSGILTRSRGAKGAGDAAPAISDLVSAGGVLAADRAQLLVWTMIGCCGYLLIVLRSPTETISMLPALNQDLLNAMGISALVYVGGKSVRLPGPVVNQIAADIAKKTLTIKGQNLHRNAVFSFDRQPIEIMSVTATPMSGGPSELFSSELVITVTAVPFTTGDHVLRVTNLDGQYAEAWFPADLPAISKVVVDSGNADEVPVSTSEKVLTLTGTAFRAGSTGEWVAPGATEPAAIPADKVVVTSDQDAKVTVTPGNKPGAGTLALVSPHNTRAVRPVTVK